MPFSLVEEQKELIQLFNLIKKIARPDMAPQDFNPWLLTFDRVVFDVSHVANTTNYDCRVSDCGLKSCRVVSERAIFFISAHFILHQDFKTSPTY
jgi:hypothetical protein